MFNFFTPMITFQSIHTTSMSLFFLTMLTERFKFFECMGHVFIFDNVIVEEMYVMALFVK